MNKTLKWALAALLLLALAGEVMMKQLAPASLTQAESPLFWLAKTLAFVGLYGLAALLFCFGSYRLFKRGLKSAWLPMLVGALIFLGSLLSWSLGIKQVQDTLAMTQHASCKPQLDELLGDNSQPLDVRHRLSQSCAASLYLDLGQRHPYINAQGRQVLYQPDPGAQAQRKQIAQTTRQLTQLAQALSIQRAVLVALWLAALVLAYVLARRQKRPQKATARRP